MARGWAIWISFVAVFGTLLLVSALTASAAGFVALGLLALAGCGVLASNYRGATRWFWLQYQRSPWTRGLDVQTIRLIGRMGTVVAAAITALALVKTIAG